MLSNRPLSRKSLSPVLSDTIVIGAGIIGMTIAERLSHDGRKVLLLDREAEGAQHYPKQNCSSGNAGHIATHAVLPLSTMETLLSLPKILLDSSGPLSIRWSYVPKMLPWLIRFGCAAKPAQVKASTLALSTLNAAALASYDRLLARTGLQNLMIKRGAITLYQTERGRHTHWHTVRVMRDHGVTVNTLTAQEISDLEPDICKDHAGAIYFPDEAHTLNPQQLLMGLKGIFLSRGGMYQQANVLTISPNDDGTVSLNTSAGVFHCCRVVIAAGAWSKPLAKILGYSVPLDTERGYHLMLPKSGVALSRPITSFEHSFVMTPMEQGLKLAGMVELAGLNASENPVHTNRLFEHAQKILPGLGCDGASRWMGFRPSLPDSLPVIAKAPRHSSIYFAFGHQHLGLTQAAITAEIVSELVTNVKPSINIEPFRIDRF